MYRLANLNRRIEASIGPEWKAEIGGVVVGTIKDAELAAIQRSCLTDPGLYAAQAKSIALSVVRLIAVIGRAIPMLAFWVCVVAAYMNPADTLAFLRDLVLLNGSPDDLRTAVSVLLKLVAMLVFMGIAISQLFRGEQPGDADNMEAAMSKAVRARFGDSSGAEVILSCWQFGRLYVNGRKTAYVGRSALQK